jgi:2-hydroxychromene-2-carboxylate isomerase
MPVFEKADAMPWFARAISSNRTRAFRRTLHRSLATLRGEQNLLRVFINPRDPFGLPLLQALSPLADRFSIRLQLHTVWQLYDAMFPEPELWQNWAQTDAIEVAKLYGLVPPDRQEAPTESELLAALAELLDLEATPDILNPAIAILTELWTDNSTHPANKKVTDHHRQQLSDNEGRLHRLGHYQGSMVYYQGEWFWGVDRLDHLEHRLMANGLEIQEDVRAKTPERETLHFTRTWEGLGRDAIKLSQDHPARTPLEVFFSIRSPYSYLGLERSVDLARAWNLPLQIRPVLPMVMRGQQVPDAKKWYIFHDTKREADKLGIPYGFVADPLGAGVERCYALFDYARSQGLEVEYLLSYARAVNAEGIRSETDRGLERIVTRAGLDWQHAKTLLADQNWRTWAEENRSEMYACGLWGVPSFRYGDINCWGQDRLWVIDNEINKKVETRHCEPHRPMPNT